VKEPETEARVKASQITPASSAMLRILHAFKQSGASKAELQASIILFLVSFAESEGISKERLKEFLQKDIDANWEHLHEDFVNFKARKRGAS
jgi:hypothetical protein